MKRLRILRSTYDSQGRLLPEGVEYDVPDGISAEDAKLLVKAKKARWLKQKAS